MKNPLAFVRTFLILAALTAGTFAATLSIQVFSRTNPTTDCGATGWAIAAGLALVALGITFSRKDS